MLASKADDKENGDPNLTPCTASKAQLIYARLAEWKHRMGVLEQPRQPAPCTSSGGSPSSHPSLGHESAKDGEPEEKKHLAAATTELPQPTDLLLTSPVKHLGSSPSQPRGSLAALPSRTASPMATMAMQQHSAIRTLGSGGTAPLSPEPASPRRSILDKTMTSSQQHSISLPEDDETKPSHQTLESRPLANTHSLPTLGEMTDEDGFELDISICDSTATLPSSAGLVQNSSTTSLEDNGESTSSSEIWERRYREEHARLESMQALLRHYERDLECALHQHEQLEQERQRNAQTQIEMHELKEELLAVTASFADMKNRYDETKGLNENLRKNEASLLATLRNLEEERTEAEARFEALRAHAEEKLASAAAEVQKALSDNRQAEARLQEVEAALAEQSKLVSFWQARAHSAETALPGLVETLQLKERENRELLAICDQLVASLQPAATEDVGATPGTEPTTQDHPK